MRLKIILFFFISIILTSCSTTNPTDVKKSETQKVTAIRYGNIISSLPVKVKGEGSLIGATTGALIGGLLGTQVCGKELIAGAKCEEIAIVYATIGGAALGYVWIIENPLNTYDEYGYPPKNAKGYASYDPHRMGYGRYYNIGICEPATVNMAAGLSKVGLNPVVHTIAPFLIAEIKKSCPSLLDLIATNNSPSRIVLESIETPATAQFLFVIMPPTASCTSLSV